MSLFAVWLAACGGPSGAPLTNAGDAEPPTDAGRVFVDSGQVTQPTDNGQTPRDASPADPDAWVDTADGGLQDAEVPGDAAPDASHEDHDASQDAEPPEKRACDGVLDGETETRTRFEAELAPFGTSCKSQAQSRTCHDGTWGDWDGAYSAVACVVALPRKCDDTDHGQGQDRVRFEKVEVVSPATCKAETQTRICNDGTWLGWSGTYEREHCSVCVDSDGDGHGAGCALGGDCDDDEPTSYFGAHEQQGNSIDEDCDGQLGQHFVKVGGGVAPGNAPGVLRGDVFVSGGGSDTLYFWKLPELIRRAATVKFTAPVEVSFARNLILVAHLIGSGAGDLIVLDASHPESGVPERGRITASPAAKFYLTHDGALLFVQEPTAAGGERPDVRVFALDATAQPKQLASFEGCVPADDDDGLLLSAGCNGNAATLYDAHDLQEIHEIDSVENAYGVDMFALQGGYAYLGDFTRRTVSAAGFSDDVEELVGTGDDLFESVRTEHGVYYLSITWWGLIEHLCKAGGACFSHAWDPGLGSWILALSADDDRLLVQGEETFRLFSVTGATPQESFRAIRPNSFTRGALHGDHVLMTSGEGVVSANMEGQFSSLAPLQDWDYGGSFSGIVRHEEQIFASGGSFGALFELTVASDGALAYSRRVDARVSPALQVIEDSEDNTWLVCADGQGSGLTWTPIPIPFPFADEASHQDAFLSGHSTTWGQRVVVFSYGSPMAFTYELHSDGLSWDRVDSYALAGDLLGNPVVRGDVLYYGTSQGLQALNLNTKEEVLYPGKPIGEVVVVGDTVAGLGEDVRLLLDGKLVATGITAPNYWDPWLASEGKRLVVGSALDYRVYDLVP